MTDWFDVPGVKELVMAGGGGGALLYLMRWAVAAWRTERMAGTEHAANTGAYKRLEDENTRLTARCAAADAALAKCHEDSLVLARKLVTVEGQLAQLRAQLAGLAEQVARLRTARTTLPPQNPPIS